VRAREIEREYDCVGEGGKGGGKKESEREREIILLDTFTIL